MDSFNREFYDKWKRVNNFTPPIFLGSVCVSGEGLSAVVMEVKHSINFWAEVSPQCQHELSFH